jgi:two-component system OmpR family sensor kinase
MRRPRPLIGGVRWRLTAWVAGVIVVCTAVIFFIVYNETGTQLRTQIERDIRGDAMQFGHVLGERPALPTAKLLTAATDYVSAQPYSQASTLLFVVAANGATVSNHRELFGSVRPDDGETPAEQARENALGLRLKTHGSGYFTEDVPDAGDVRLYETSVQTAAGRLTVGAGEALATVSRSQDGVARSFLLGGAITLVLAILASYLIGARISAPLRRLAWVAARVDAGDLEPRIEVDSSATGEVRVLAEAFNHMLDRLALAFARQREFVADASHELRTPLTVIRGQLELLAADPDPGRDEVRRVERLVQAEISRIARLVEDLLLLAQADRTDFLRPRQIELRTFIAELWDGISLLATRDFQLGDVPHATLVADPDRLAQALRNLGRNAIEHTTEPDGLVRLELELTGAGAIRFSVIDDGPGIPPGERNRVFERFHRTDPARTRSAGGAGLGLAIVRAIAIAHPGSVRATSSPEGGAQLELELPGAVVSPAAAPTVARR